MRDLVKLLFFCVFFSGKALAFEATDQSFIKPNTEKSWGERFFELFNQADFGKSFALVIGVSRYSEFSDLPTSEDPHRVRRYLMSDADFDYVHVLTEENVTVERVRELIQRDFKELVGENDRFLLYWSGHGATEKSGIGREVGLLATSKSNESDVFSMIRMTDISRWTEWIPAKQTLFIFDSCFSGHSGLKAQSFKNLTLRDMSKPSRHILTAGTADQETFASEHLKGGVFTRAVLDGLDGLADASQGGSEPDGIISVNELEIYVKNRVRQERQRHNWQKDLSPQLFSIGSSEGEFFFVSPHSKNRNTEVSSSRTSNNERDTVSMDTSEKSAPDQIAGIPPAKPNQAAVPVTQKGLLALVQGEWSSPQYRYGFFIEGMEGKATLSNAPNVYQVGDTMLRIDEVGEDKIIGRQIFTDGSWRSVSLSLVNNEMIMEGGGFKWAMKRR